MEGRSGVRLSGKQHVRQPVGAIDFDPSRYFSKLQASSLDRVSQFAVVVAGEAARRAGIQVDLANRDRVGVFLGTGMGGAETLEATYAAFFGAEHQAQRVLLAIPAIMPHAAAAQIAMSLGVRGECQTYSTACSSASVAIGEALRRIRAGDLDCAFAGGSESLLTPAVIHHWEKLKVLAKTADDPATGCRPFSKDRTGFSLAEGACVFVLEEYEHARDRGAPILAELLGYGVSNDATHLTKPDADGQALAIERALADSGLSVSDIGYINAHGTATLVGDAVETESIKKVFGARAYGIPVSGTKSSHGHAMGAGGAIELCAAVLALVHRAIPPTAFWTTRDSQCDLDYVPGKGRPADGLQHVMSNSFAFGGNNAVLVAGRAS